MIDHRVNAKAITIIMPKVQFKLFPFLLRRIERKYFNWSKTTNNLPDKIMISRKNVQSCKRWVLEISRRSKIWLFALTKLKIKDRWPPKLKLYNLPTLNLVIVLLMELKAFHFCPKSRNYKHHIKGYKLGHVKGQSAYNVENISKTSCITNVFRETN